MPELPEVETVRRSLIPYLEGRVIRDLSVFWKRAVHGSGAAALRERLVGRRIVALERRAKYLTLRLDRGFLLIHLRMTGKLYPAPELPAVRKHLSAALALDAPAPGGAWLLFEDQRRFGRLFYFADEQAYSQFSERFGPEPLGAEFTADWLTHELKQHRRQIKPLLLDQEFIAGLGNIYVDESLWMAGIHPLARSDRVRPDRAARLHHSIREVLAASIKANGTTFLNFKFLGGKSGGYTDQLLVFSRQGEACPRCGALIQKLRVAQRGTHICPRCQRPPQNPAARKSATQGRASGKAGA